MIDCGGTEPRRAAQLTGLSAILLCALGLLALATILRLAPEWRRNPDLSHGFFTPFVFAILIREAFRVKGRHLAPSATVIAIILALALGGLIFQVLAGLYASALEWTHAIVEFLFALSFCSFLAAAWLSCALKPLRIISFCWPAAAGIVCWLLSAPIPPGTYTRLTLELQVLVTHGVVATLHLLGVPAINEGNVINLAHVSVGVEEACSGVRSLISCVFAGVFLSGTICRHWASRALVLLASAPLAIAMNFLRSLLLTLLAYNEIEIRGFWHDATGFAILAVTASLLWMLAWSSEQFLSKQHSFSRSPFVVETALRESLSPRRGPLRIVTAALVLAISIQILFVAKTRSTSSAADATVNVLGVLPERAEGWEVVTNADLHQFSSQLQTNFLAQRTYVRAADKTPTQITVYLAYWPAGQASVSLVAAHTPEACWPGAGWVETSRGSQRVAVDIADRALPDAEYRGFVLGAYPQNVWYWQLFGGEVIHPNALTSPTKLLSLAWHYGFRKDEPQLFVRVSSNRAWKEIADEPLLRDIFDRLKTAGL